MIDVFLMMSVLCYLCGLVWFELSLFIYSFLFLEDCFTCVVNGVFCNLPLPGGLLAGPDGQSCVACVASKQPMESLH